MKILNDLHKCSRCLVYKDKSLFYRSSDRECGVRSPCRDCRINKTPRPSLMQLFLSKFRKEPSGCWVWLGSLNNRKYGKIKFLGRCISSHRLSWELHNNKIIPHGMCVLHRCDNPPCVNPDHLFLGTNSENSKDMTNKNRQAKGIRNGQSVLTEDAVLEIRRRSNESSRSLGLEFNVSKTTILNIINRKRWRHIP